MENEYTIRANIGVLTNQTTILEIEYEPAQDILIFRTLDEEIPIELRLERDSLPRMIEDLIEFEKLLKIIKK